MQELDLQFVQEVKGLLAAHHAEIEKRFITTEEAKASTDKLSAAMTELIEAKNKEIEAKNERLIKERTSRPPIPGVPADLDLRSLGQRMAESESYKAFAANVEGQGRSRVSISVKGRIREQKAAGTITEAGSGWPFVPYRAGVFGPPTLPMIMRDLFTVVPLSGTNSVDYVQETWNYAADYQVAEGDKKAQGDVTYTPQSATVKTIAWFVKVSRQMLADAPYFASTVDSQLLYGIAKKEDHELLWGDGATGHLQGIMTVAPALPADVLTPASVIYSADTIAAAVAYLGSLGYAPTAIVMNPIDWANMQISKTAQGVYVLGGPPAGNAPATLWGLPVLTTMNMTAGSFLVGSFPANAALFDREAANADIAYENEDDFVRNLATIRAEERILLAIYRPQAFVKGTFPVVVPGGLTAPAPQHMNRERDRK